MPSNAWDINNVMNVTKAETGGSLTEKFVLIDNEKESSSDKMSGYHRIWDITKLRDMTVCGFYVHAGGPSFFQRMVANAQSLQSNELGIESFLVGQWAGGALDTHNDYRSRLDWEFYQNIQGQDEIKGMPGCKNAQMCKSDSDATSEGVGLFKLTQNATERYGMDGIACVTTSQSPWPFQFPSCSP